MHVYFLFFSTCLHCILEITFRCCDDTCFSEKEMVESFAILTYKQSESIPLRLKIMEKNLDCEEKNEYGDCNTVMESENAY